MTQDDGKIKDTHQVAEDDTQGHSLLLDTDYHIGRKPRDLEMERGVRERRQPKEARGNKPERR